MDSADGAGEATLGEQAPLPSMLGDEVLSRLKAASGSASDSALASFLKVPYSTLASWRRRNAVPIEAIITVSEFSGATIDWLLLGKSRNGVKQTETSVRPLYPNFSQLALEYALEFTNVFHSEKVENLRTFKIAVAAACLAAQSTIDQIIQYQGGNEDKLREQMDIWITRIILNAKGKAKPES